MTHPSLRLFLLIASACSAWGSSETVGVEPMMTALQGNDECTAGTESEQCALAALQLRGVRAAGHVVKSSVDLSSCASNAIGDMIQDLAPACVRACPRLCADAVHFLALKSTLPRDRMRDLICAHPKMLDCVLEPENAESCAELLKELPADWPGMPKSEGDIQKACAGDSTGAGAVLLEEDQGTEVTALAARASAGDATAARELLDRAMVGKWKDERCASAPEGQMCVPNPQGGHSEAYIYCSAHKRISVDQTNCPARRGPMSWCVGGSTVVAHDHCDDPFCRNGGAYAGDGLYCHKGMVMRCNGLNAPVIVDSCSSRCHDEDCTILEHYTCAGHHPNPYCRFDYTSTADELASDSIYQESTAQAFAELANLAVCGDAPHSPLLRTYSCAACKADSPSWDLVPGSWRPISMGDFLEKHAIFVYVAKMTLASGRPVKNAWEGACIVSLRGSVSTANWVRDFQLLQLSLNKSTCPGCAVHHGFRDMWQKMQGTVIEALHDMGCKENTASDQVYFTGHSLGAGVAIIGMFELQDLGFKVQESFVFEPPLPGNRAFADAFAKHFGRPVAVWRITHAKDPIIHTPRRYFGWTTIGKEVFYDTAAGLGEYTVCDGYWDGNCSYKYPWIVTDFHMQDHCTTPLLPSGNICAKGGRPAACPKE